MYYQLQSFIAIADLQSVSLAAKKIHLTQPALTQHIRYLEDRFKAKLLRRQGNAMELTPEGRRLYECAKGIVAELDGLEEMFHFGDTQKKKIIRFSTIDSVTNSILPAAIKAFLATNPDVQLIPSIEASGVAVRDLLKGSTDLALVTLGNMPRTVGTEELFNERMIFIGATEYRDLSKIRITKLPFILFPKTSITRALIDDVFAKLKIAPSILFESMKVSAIVSFVEAGMGISIVPYHSVEKDLAGGRICELSVPTGASRSVGVAFRKSEPLAAYAISFIKSLREASTKLNGSTAKRSRR